MAVIYRLWDKDGQLLYIGHSKGVLSRLGDHIAEKQWITQVVSVTLEHFSSVEEAKAVETRAIKDEFPLHNVVGVTDPLYRDPSELIDLLGSRERRIVGGILYGLGSMRGPLDDIDSLSRMLNILRDLGRNISKPPSHLEAVLEKDRRADRAQTIGLGVGYKSGEIGEVPSQRIREGIRQVNRLQATGELKAVNL
jgi:hypothetical protein